LQYVGGSVSIALASLGAQWFIEYVGGGQRTADK
jgi:hypothetical protein